MKIDEMIHRNSEPKLTNSAVAILLPKLQNSDFGLKRPYRYFTPDVRGITLSHRVSECSSMVCVRNGVPMGGGIGVRGKLPIGKTPASRRVSRRMMCGNSCYSDRQDRMNHPRRHVAARGRASILCRLCQSSCWYLLLSQNGFALTCIHLSRSHAIR